MLLVEFATEAGDLSTARDTIVRGLRGVPTTWCSSEPA